MPINWNVSHSEQLVELRIDGILHYGDYEGALTGVLAESAMPYRKLLDAREGYTALHEDEIEAYTSALAHQARLDNFGPYAVVVGPDEGRAHDSIQSRFLLLRSRPIRMFFSVDEAYDWLRSQPVPGVYSGLSQRLAGFAS